MPEIRLDAGPLASCRRTVIMLHIAIAHAVKLIQDAGYKVSSCTKLRSATSVWERRRKRMDIA
jgi:hypothetical protein